MKPHVELPNFILEHQPWSQNANPIWPLSTFSIKRNIGKYPFPPKLQEDQIHQLFDLVKNIFLNTTLFQGPIVFQGEEISPIDREYLFEHFLSSDTFQNLQAGQGFLFDKTCRLLALINAQDHLQLQWTDTNGEWIKGYSSLSKIENELGTVLDFAFDPRFGYLTTDPGNSGTGLTAAIYLHLPGLIRKGQLMETLSRSKEEDILTSGMTGVMGDFLGDIVVLRNRYSLGLSEETILHSLEMTASRLIGAETALREFLKKENNIELRDQIGRAYGLVVHSCQLTTKEALEALSLLKLGINLGWVEGMSDSEINTLFFQSRRAHLQRLANEKFENNFDMNRYRANFLKNHLQKLQLKAA